MTDLPNGWQYKTLGEVAKWGSGGTPRAGTKSFYDGDIPWAIIGDLNDSYVTQTARTITQKGLDESSAKMVPVGAVLIAMYGSIGKLGMNTIPMATNQAIAFAIPKTELVLQRYLFHYLSSQREIFLWSGKGATQQNISQTLLKAWKIPLPPLPEQQKIVEIIEDHLSRLDAALADVKQAKLKAAQFRRSLLKSTFEEFSENSVRIGEVVTFNRKKPVELKNSKTEVSFVPMPKVSEVSGQISLDEHISHSEGQRRSLTYFENGDVIFAKITPCMENGKIALAKNLLNGAAYGSTEFHVLTPTERILPDYLRYFIGSDDFRANAERAMTGAVGQRRVPKTYLDQHEIPLPSIDIQVGIVANLDEALSRTDEAVKAAEQIDKEAARLRRSLLQTAFTGQLTKEVASV